MGVSQLRKPRSEYAVCGEENLRLYRHAVLESGEDAGDPGQSAASVGTQAHNGDGKKRCIRRKTGAFCVGKIWDKR